MGKNKSKLSKALLSGLYGLLGFIALTIVLLAVAPNFMLNTFGFRTYVTHYDQMEPTIGSGALVFVTRSDVADFNDGDLVTFQSNTDLNNDGNNDLITSYLNRTTGTGEDTYYYFRSEGSSSDWAVLEASSIVGGYGFSIPVLGLIVDFIASPFGIAVVVLNIAIIVGIVIVVKSGHKDKKEIETK